MKKVGRFSLSELQDDTSVIDKEYQKTLIGGRSYTPQEFGYLINSGQWHGGWVYGMGWVTPEVTIYPNSYNYSGGYYPSGHNGGGSVPFWPGGGWHNGGGNTDGYPGHNSYYNHTNYNSNHNNNWGHNGYSNHYSYQGSYGYHFSGGGGGGGDVVDSTTSFLDDLKSYLKKSLSSLIAGSAETAHELYEKMSSFMQQHPGSIDTVRSYMSELGDYVKPIVEDDPDKMDWEDLFNIWMFELETSNISRDENGNILITFMEDAQTTKDLQTQEGVLRARDEAIERIQNGDFSNLNKAWSYDVDEFFDGIMTMNTATSFLGSYNTKVEIINNNDGTYQLNYEVSNDSGWESATRLRVSHEHSYHDGIIPNSKRGEGIGLGGTISEKWQWSETIMID